MLNHSCHANAKRSFGTPVQKSLTQSSSRSRRSKTRALASLFQRENSSTTGTIYAVPPPTIAKTTQGTLPREQDGSGAVPMGDRCRGRAGAAMRSPPSRFILLGMLGALALLGVLPEGVSATGNIGCLFSNTLCEDEWCFDDYAFGRCFPTKADLKEEDLVRYHLGEEELHLLEAEMQRLYHLGYRWSHTYTQCVLQALLQALHLRADFDVTSCNDELDQDLEGALRAIEGEEQEAVNPRDLAIVRFTPSATDPHSDYADEFYFPAIEGGKLLPAPYRQHGEEAGQPSSTKIPNHLGDVEASSEQSKQQASSTANAKFGNSVGVLSSKANTGDAKPGKDTKGVNSGKTSAQEHPGVQHKMGRQNDGTGFPPGASKSDGSKQEKNSAYNKTPYGSQFVGNPIIEKVKNYNDFPRDIPYDLHGYQADSGYGYDPAYPSERFVDDGFKSGLEFQKGSYGSGHGYPNDGYMAGQGYKNNGYMADQGYANDGFVADQGYLNDVMMRDQPYGEDPEDNEILFEPNAFDLRLPTTQQKSNKDFLKQFEFHVPEYEDYDDAPAYHAHQPSRTYNPIYRKRDNSTRPEKKFNLRNFMVDFDNYIAAEQRLNNQSKKSGNNGFAQGSGGQISPIQGVPASQLQALQEKLDPELRKGFMSVAIDVMRRGRYGQTKPHYNTAHLKKLAALLDELRTMQHVGPPPDAPRFLPRSDEPPVFGTPSRGSPEEPLDTAQTNEIADALHGRQPNGAGGYLRVDKAIPRDYPLPPHPHTDRYAYATDDNAGGFYDPAQEGAYFKPPVEQGFGAQFNYPHFYKVDGANYGGQGGYSYDYPSYDYGRQAVRGDGGEDPSSFVKKDEENADSDYGTLMSAEGQPLANNFARPERLDVKKPGPYYGVNHYGFENYYDTFYDPNYDHGQYPPRKLGFAYYDYGADPYHHYGKDYDSYMDVEDVDSVGGDDKDEGAGDGDGSYPNDEGGASRGGRDKVRYVDANGNEIDIGLSTGRGGMIPMSRNSFEENGERFSELLRQQGLEGSSLHPGPGHERLRMHQGQMPDLLLTEEMVVDDVGNGLANQQHAKMPMGPHALHPMRLNMPMPHGALNNTGGAHADPSREPQSPPPAPTYVYVDVNMSFSSRGEASDLASLILHNAGLSREDIKDLRVEDNRMLFTLRDNLKGVTEQDIADKAEELAPSIEKDWNVRITRAGVASSQGSGWSLVEGGGSERRLMVGLAVVSGVMAAAVVAATGVLVLRRHAAQRSKLRGLGNRDSEASKDYQDLCRARMAAKTKTASDGLPGTHTAAAQRVSSLSKESDNGGNSPGSRSSTSSWSEEPVAPNMDISTGHMVLSYMEDHLQNKSRLEQEWLALCAYEAEPSATMVAKKPTNQKKNRYPGVLPYDHNRVHLNQQANISGSDYVNASSITDHDPRNPAYIATQGPLATTTADFWQLVWEQGSVVIVMLTRLNESGHTLCHHYWPQEGSQLYHIYEVHLVSEHIWCDDYLVRSFYLKNTRTGETRTVTQFHFLSWPDTAIPASTKALLEFRRKVNKSYRGRSCPIVVHCSDGIGRAGTYILIDMVLNRMAKGAKEIDIAATLEHIRDQRANMVTTKLQFEFVLMAVAEEVHAILKALPQ